MSAPPEKKILREMLLKLKAKIITSQNMFFALSITVSESNTKTLQEILEKATEMPEGKEKEKFLLFLALLQTMNQNFNMLTTNVGYLVDDINLYIDTLERYSTELDNTLTDIFEKAKQYAEEQRKQQEELRKKEPSYRA